MVHHTQVVANVSSAGSSSNNGFSSSASSSRVSRSHSWQLVEADLKKQHQVQSHAHQLVVQPFQLQQISSCSNHNTSNHHKFQHFDFFQHYYLQHRHPHHYHHHVQYSFQHQQVRHQFVKVADSLYGPILRVHCSSPTSSASSSSTSSSSPSSAASTPTSSPSCSPTTCSQLNTEIDCDTTSTLSNLSHSAPASTLLADTQTQPDDQVEEDQEYVYVVKEIDLSQARRRLCLQREADNPFQERKVATFLLQNGGHDHIVKYHQIHVDEREHKLVFVMEDCPRGDLWSFLMHVIDAQPTGQTPPTLPVVAEHQALKWLGQLVSAVGFLHAHDIAHRDLSLENVLLNAENNCKLIDFGLSVSNASKFCHDQVGKEYYMAPEIVQNYQNAPYDPRKADVWALGVMLFMLLTGSVLCQLASASNTTIQIVAQKDGIARILALWQGHVAASTVDLLSQMLQVDPSKRLELHQVAQHEALRGLCGLK